MQNLQIASYLKMYWSFDFYLTFSVNKNDLQLSHVYASDNQIDRNGMWNLFEFSCEQFSLKVVTNLFIQKPSIYSRPLYFRKNRKKDYFSHVRCLPICLHEHFNILKMQVEQVFESHVCNFNINICIIYSFRLLIQIVNYTAIIIRVCLNS